MSVPAPAMDIERFLRERQPRWKALERMLDTLAATGQADGREPLLELLRLYRLACSDLIQARALTANPEVLAQLNQLVGRAYRFLYQAAPSTGAGARAGLRRLLGVDIPATFTRQARWVVLAAGIFLLGALVGLVAVLLDPENGRLVIPAEFFTQSPSDRVAHIESSAERIDSLTKAAGFGSSLYTHNIQVSFLCFAAGALSLIGAGWLLFYNGVMLGAVGGMYLLDGVGTFFLAWVGPHGALELPAIIFASAAGLTLGQALWLPGEVGRAQALRARMPESLRMLGAAALMLVVAGLIEGSFSQFSSKTMPYPVKIAVAVVLFLGMLHWLFGPRRRGAGP